MKVYVLEMVAIDHPEYELLLGVYATQEKAITQAKKELEDIAKDEGETANIQVREVTKAQTAVTDGFCGYYVTETEVE